MRSPSYRPERAVVALTGHTLREPRWSSHARTVFLDIKLLESSFMRITEAARRLGTSARMLRYREELGLLPQVRDQMAGPVRRSAGVTGAGAGGPGLGGAGVAGAGLGGAG